MNDRLSIRKRTTHAKSKKKETAIDGTKRIYMDDP